MEKKKKTFKIRNIVQTIFFLIVLTIAVTKILSGNGISIPFVEAISLHAICPFGGVVTFYSYITAGIFVQKIHMASLVLMYAVLVLAVLFGPVFCGWVCPFGTFQEWISHLGKKIFGKKYNQFIPKKLDNILRYLRYVILGLVVYNTAVTTKLLFQNYDPYFALFNMFTNEVAITAYISLGVVFVLSLFVERPFCKYACPYGAFLGISNLFKIFKINRNTETCVNCKACSKDCPMNIDVSSKNKVYNHQCISCMKCTSENACPVKNTVELKVGKGGKTSIGGTKNEN